MPKSRVITYQKITRISRYKLGLYKAVPREGKADLFMPNRAWTMHAGPGCLLNVCQWKVRRILCARPGPAPDTVGSYGTRNIVVIGIISYWERPTDCLVYCLCLSSSFRGIPFSWGIRLALSLRPKEKTHVRYGANKWCLQSNRYYSSYGRPSARSLGRTA